jgi:hypothetical protein
MPTTLDSNPNFYVTPEREAEYGSSAYNFRYQASLHSVGNYQVAGIPHVTTVTASNPYTTISFPSVTRAVTVTSMAGTLTGSFTTNFTNKFYVPAGTTARLEVKVTNLYISGSTSASVVGELTGISTHYIQNNWSGSLAAKV